MAERTREASDAGADPPLPRCRCGHDRRHHLVSTSFDYSFGGWCLSLIGISARPRAIRYVCRRCEQVFDKTTDPKTIDQTPLWG